MLTQKKKEVTGELCGLSQLTKTYMILYYHDAIKLTISSVLSLYRIETISLNPEVLVSLPIRQLTHTTLTFLMLHDYLGNLDANILNRVLG